MDCFVIDYYLLLFLSGVAADDLVAESFPWFLRSSHLCWFLGLVDFFCGRLQDDVVVQRYWRTARFDWKRLRDSFSWSFPLLLRSGISSIVMCLSVGDGDLNDDVILLHNRVYTERFSLSVWWATRSSSTSSYATRKCRQWPTCIFSTWPWQMNAF